MALRLRRRQLHPDDRMVREGPVREPRGLLRRVESCVAVSDEVRPQGDEDTVDGAERLGVAVVVRR
eukprot:8605370-Pyramimonas_sp.AAC.1